MATADRVEVMIYVQHLLGVGHLSRAAAIARACSDAGLSVTLVSGGLPVPTLDVGKARLLQLPPLKARDADFTGLVDEAGQPIDEAMKVARRDRLLACFEACDPKALIVELYPFGRRQLRFELEPLIAAARTREPRPWLLCSLRDILNPVSEAKADWAVQQVRESFDRVFVHSDPAMTTLDASFPRADAIADKLHYTGYVLETKPSEPAPTSEGAGEIIVSTGGGAVGRELIDTALAARPLSPFAEFPWRILVGSNLPESDFARARADAPDGVRVERARPDFQSLLARCRLSVSQGGYNTVLEILQAGVPAVIVPFASDGEREQTLRAEAMAAKGLLHHLPAETLSPERLAEVMASARPPSLGLGLDLGGTEKTAKIVRDLIARVPN